MSFGRMGRRECGESIWRMCNWHMMMKLELWKSDQIWEVLKVKLTGVTEIWKWIVKEKNYLHIAMREPFVHPFIQSVSQPVNQHIFKDCSHSSSQSMICGPWEILRPLQRYPSDQNCVHNTTKMLFVSFTLIFAQKSGGGFQKLHNHGWYIRLKARADRRTPCPFIQSDIKRLEKLWNSINSLDFGKCCHCS